MLGNYELALLVKRLPANVGDLGLIPELGRLSGEGNGNPLQYSCLENSMDIQFYVCMTKPTAML